MPRQPRYNLSGIPQHVVQRGNNRQATFFHSQDYEYYLYCLKIAAQRHQCDIHAYVLMPNHVHILTTPHDDAGIAKMMQSVGRRYVQYVNHKYSRTGTLWEGRYKASLIDPEQYLLACYRYIELNPVRADMAQGLGDYPWSSYRWHAYGEDNDIVTDHAQYQQLGTGRKTRQLSYRELFHEYRDESLLNEIRASLNQCRVLGCDRFKDEIETRLMRSVKPGKRGRPRKADAVFKENRV